jgi:FMN phosphatase YigB (HAD superfamily)/rhamnose utilization protein RhaD (predicted bifunctional aldolase and dehydrogenase)
MFYKGIIFDLDNTLYDYDLCHDKAIKEVFNYIIQNNNTLIFSYIEDVYKKIYKNLKNELGHTASSHNKSIYFKQLLETLNINLSLFSVINNLYWQTFYVNLVCFDGVYDFIIWNKNNGIKIGILTDYETEYQINKLDKLGLLKYIDIIVTSEEVGIEKPSTKMFFNILEKMGLSSNEVIMIGDNYDKDIKGALNVGIKSYWFNKDNSEFFTFKEMLSKFNLIHNELIEFKKISKYCGERFDLVQAGGGNTSVKINELLFIKASGYNLANIDVFNGFVTINNKILLEDIYNDNVKDVTNYNFIGNKRGSIETFMHSILKKYTVHLHPIQINRVLISLNAKDIIRQIYPDSLVINYLTPGIKVCNEINKRYNNENVIFLLNHGVIITCDTINKVYEIIEDVLIKFERYLELNVNFDKYKNVNKVSKLINSTFGVENISYLCEDKEIIYYLNNKQELFKEKITFPDCLIYCGVKVLFGIDNIEIYKNKYEEYPKVIVENKAVYINSHSITKCREIEEVFKSSLLILDSHFQKVYLENEEICFLNNWDAEKYRKLL